MAPKRATVPSDAFAKPPSALDKLTGRASTEDTVKSQDRNTVIPQTGADESAREKITFYLRPDQIDKLDELVLAYKRQTGKRINRNEVVRRLIDLCDLDLLLHASQR
jgi:hypothetical protein